MLLAKYTSSFLSSYKLPNCASLWPFSSWRSTHSHNIYRWGILIIAISFQLIWKPQIFVAAAINQSQTIFADLGATFVVIVFIYAILALESWSRRSNCWSNESFISTCRSYNSIISFFLPRTVWSITFWNEIVPSSCRSVPRSFASSVVPINYHNIYIIHRRWEQPWINSLLTLA